MGLNKKGGDYGSDGSGNVNADADLTLNSVVLGDDGKNITVSTAYYYTYSFSFIPASRLITENYIGTYNAYPSGYITIYIKDSGSSYGASSKFEISRDFGENPICIAMNGAMTQYGIFVRIINDGSFEIFFNSPSSNTNTINFGININSNGNRISDTNSNPVDDTGIVEIEYPQYIDTGDTSGNFFTGIGGKPNRNGSTVQIIDPSATGITYSDDFSANYNDRTLIDLGYANSVYSKIASQAIGSLVVSNNTSQTVIGTQNTFVDLVIDPNTTSEASNNELFTITNYSNLEIRYDDINPKSLIFSALVSVIANNQTDIYSYKLLKNGIDLPAPDNVNVPIEITSRVVTFNPFWHIQVIKDDVLKMQVTDIEGANTLTHLSIKYHIQ